MTDVAKTVGEQEADRLTAALGFSGATVTNADCEHTIRETHWLGRDVTPMHAEDAVIHLFYQRGERSWRITLEEVPF